MAIFSRATAAAKGTLPKSLRAPGPVTPASLLGDLTPPDATAARSAATVDALAAAKRARKRAGAGALGTTPPILGGQPLAPAVLQPRSLVGY